ncbi:MAG TPA: dTMP kinase [Rhizomicrobium sp.]|nr:dTMP kinase [Rhizomicrobium sp.]
MAKAHFITLEGGEGAGKSTHARALSEALNERGIANIVTREPGGSPGAEEIRSILVAGEPGRWDATTELLLMFAARADHIARTIKPALASGQWVICDRFTDSTYAYQGAGRGVPTDLIRKVEEAAVANFRPDLTLILDVPVDVAMTRIGDRTHSENRFEKFDHGFHERLRDHFRKLAKDEPQRCLLIDTTAPAEQVSRDIWRAVAGKFGL